MCHGRHSYREGLAPRHTEPEPERGDLRVSDADRDRTVEGLREHAQAGRLTSEELEERVGAALRATTRADLSALTHDLPETRAPRRPAPARARHRHHGPPLVPIAVLLVAIWALTGAGYFWPVWPLLWFAFAAFARAGHRSVTR